MSRLTPDACVIGAGAAGTALAMRLAAAGRRVIVVEHGDGGGTVPLAIGMNTLIAAATNAHRVSRGAGLTEVPPDSTFRAVARHVRAVQAQTAPARAMERLTALGIDVVRERGRFRDKRTVIAGAHEIQARDFIVATGAATRLPSIDGLETVDYLTDESVLALSRRPARLVIAGGGPYALPYAQAMHRLGCAVTLIASGPLLDDMEPDQAAMLLSSLRAEGIAIETQASILQVEPRGKTGALVHMRMEEAHEDRVIEASRFLVMRERVPAVDGLDLSKAGAWTGPKGILVDAALRTRNRRVYAIGDVVGGFCTVGQAECHAAAVAHTILRGKRNGVGAAAAPRVMFTDPQIASIGLTEAQSRDRRGTRTVRAPLADIEHAVATGTQAGFIKIVTDRRHAILGVSIMAENAAEMIGVWSLAMQHRLTLADMAAAAPAFPTAGEIGKRAALFYFATAAARPRTLWGIRLPHLFG